MGPLRDEPARLITTLYLCFPFSGCYPSILPGWAGETINKGYWSAGEVSSVPVDAAASPGSGAELTRAYCAEAKVPYTETALLASYANVITYLNKVRLSGRDPFECPMVSA